LQTSRTIFIAVSSISAPVRPFLQRTDIAAEWEADLMPETFRIAIDSAASAVDRFGSVSSALRRLRADLVPAVVRLWRPAGQAATIRS
jgi:hypothetical protein